MSVVSVAAEVGVADVGEARAAAVAMGARSLPESCRVSDAVIARQDDRPVGVMLFSPLDLAPTSSMSLMVVRHRVDPMLDLLLNRPVRVAMFAAAAQLLADGHRRRTRVYCRQLRGRANHAGMLEDAGWVRQGTCWVSSANPGGSGGATLLPDADWFNQAS